MSNNVWSLREGSYAQHYIIYSLISQVEQAVTTAVWAVTGHVIVKLKFNDKISIIYSQYEQ